MIRTNMKDTVTMVTERLSGGKDKNWLVNNLDATTQ